MGNPYVIYINNYQLFVVNYCNCQEVTGLWCGSRVAQCLGAGVGVPPGTREDNGCCVRALFSARGAGAPEAVAKCGRVRRISTSCATLTLGLRVNPEARPLREAVRSLGV